MHLPNARWAICTSATRAYATSALGLTGIPIPDVFVASEDVQQGKPFPDPYLLGAKKCDVNPENCTPHPFIHLVLQELTPICLPGLVFEDAPNGIRSGNAAGCKTVGLLTTHSREQIENAKPDFIVKDLTSYVCPNCCPTSI
jgi:glycerol 3-phosphatase-1